MIEKDPGALVRGQFSGAGEGVSHQDKRVSRDGTATLFENRARRLGGRPEGLPDHAIHEVGLEAGLVGQDDGRRIKRIRDCRESRLEGVAQATPRVRRVDEVDIGAFRGRSGKGSFSADHDPDVFHLRMEESLNDMLQEGSAFPGQEQFRLSHPA